MGIPSLYLERQHPLNPTHLSHHHTHTNHEVAIRSRYPGRPGHQCHGLRDRGGRRCQAGFINVGSDGTTSLTFNATSIQNAVVLLLFLGLIGALIVPLFLGAAETAEDTGYGYASPDTGYEEPATGYGYAKRSIIDFAPVAAQLAAAQQKYGDEE